MVPKTGTKVPKIAELPSHTEFARAIGRALRSELGASRRATKSVMGWARVSDRTARKWLQGSACPGGLHLIVLSANCQAVMAIVLELTGYGTVHVALELGKVEAALSSAMLTVQELLSAR